VCSVLVTAHNACLYISLSDQLTKFISDLASSTSNSSSSSSSSEVLQWCATGAWPSCSGQYSWALVPKTAHSYADICSAWPQLAAVDSPTVEQTGYSAYLIVHPAELTSTAAAVAAAAAAVAPAAVAQSTVTAQQHDVQQRRLSGCDAPWPLPPSPLSPVRLCTTAAAAVMPMHMGYNNASGALRGGASMQSPVMPMLPPLQQPLLRQLTPEVFRKPAVAAATANNSSGFQAASSDIDALHRVPRRHSNSSDSVESAGSRSSAKQYNSSVAQYQQGTKRSRSPPATQRRDSSSSSSTSSSSYRHRTSFGDEISYKSFTADARYDDTRKQHSSGNDGSRSHHNAVHKNDVRDEKRARRDSRSPIRDSSSRRAHDGSRHSHTRSRSSSRERSEHRNEHSKQPQQERKRSRSTSSSRSDDSGGKRRATKQRSSSVAEQQSAAAQALTAQSSTAAYEARKQARAAALAAKAGSSSTAAVAAAAAAEPSVVSPAISPTLLPATHADFSTELDNSAAVPTPMQPVRKFVGTSVLQCEPVAATYSSDQAASAAALALAAPPATVGATLVQPTSSSSAQWHDSAVLSADTDAFAEGCAQVSANGPVQCPASWSWANTSPKQSSPNTSTSTTNRCAAAKSEAVSAALALNSNNHDDSGEQGMDMSQ
jgi:hypothetical protein